MQRLICCVLSLALLIWGSNKSKCDISIDLDYIQNVLKYASLTGLVSGGESILLYWQGLVIKYAYFARLLFDNYSTSVKYIT